MGRHADAGWIIAELKRVVHKTPTVKALLEALSAGKPGARPDGYVRLANQTLPEMARIVGRVVYAYNAAKRDTEDAGTFTAAQMDAVTRHYREVLDLAPPSKPARLTFRPMWPMTLAQLRAQVAELPPEEPRTNPAPLILRERAVQKQYPSFGVGRALAARSSVDTRAAGVDPQTQRDYRALEGIAWNLSAPEGFPPYPRRGGVYSDNEASAIGGWLTNHWPVIREAKQIAMAKDRERARAGISPATLDRLIEGRSGGDREGAFLHYLDERVLRHGVFPSSADKSPRDFHADILRWARRNLLPTLDAIEDFDLALLERQADPDAHMRGLADNPITKYAVSNAAEYLYGLDRHAQEWTKALTGRDRADKPVDLVSAYPARDATDYIKVFPLSVLLAAKARADAAYRAKSEREEAGKQRDRAAAIPKLRAMLDAGRAFTRANITAALPGYTLSVYPYSHSTSVHLRGPSGDIGIEYGDGRTLTDALEKLRYRLGL